jgi:lysophospholipase L1-like esterase
MRSWGLTLLDGRRVLVESGVPLGQLYYADGGHYSPQGNRLIATALKPLLASETLP